MKNWQATQILMSQSDKSKHLVFVLLCKVFFFYLTSIQRLFFLFGELFLRLYIVALLCIWVETIIVKFLAQEKSTWC